MADTDAGTSADRVELTELDIITRYSLAVRSATANRDEVIEALRADLAWLESTGPARPSRRPVAKKAAVRKTATRRR